MRTDAGNSKRRRHAAWGAETSSGGWRVTGVGNVQVDGVPRQERRWGVRVLERCYGDERLLMGRAVGWRRESRKIQKRLRHVGQEGLE